MELESGSMTPAALHLRANGWEQPGTTPGMADLTPYGLYAAANGREEHQHVPKAPTPSLTPDAMRALGSRLLAAEFGSGMNAAATQAAITRHEAA